jgi:hypothetical protein
MIRFQSIDGSPPKIKGLTHIIGKSEVYAFIIVLFVALCSYYIGRLSIIEKDRKPVTIERYSLGAIPDGAVINQSAARVGPHTSTEAAANSEIVNKGIYVGSKTGNKYHLPTCPGAQQIQIFNQIWFQSKTEAEAAGYTKALNCKGI